MRRPTEQQIKAARNRVRSKGTASDDVVWLSMLAVRDPECRDCTMKIAAHAIIMLELPPAKRLAAQGIINGAFTAGMHIGLEVEP